ncbi:MAG: hypothetical protein QOI26_2226 [Pseudonocardiales bacterium]|jgi:hypothetical protein|nr:hypothetical protein [Pseudonocardiales bacterium]
MNLRHYPPARTIHDADCPDAPPGQIVFRAGSLLLAYPNAVPHTCFTRDTVLRNRDVVAEAVEYEPHPYRPSGATQPDAVRPLCRTCRGTHPDWSEPAHPAGFSPTSGQQS